MGVSVEIEWDFAAAGIGVEVDENGRRKKSEVHRFIEFVGRYGYRNVI